MSFGRVLGVFWPLLGAPWASLGRRLGVPGHLLDALGALLGASCLSWTLPSSILRDLGRPGQGLRVLWDQFWACFLRADAGST